MTLRIGPGPFIFAAFWLFFLVAGQSKLLRDPGTFWHTKVGEKILSEGFFDNDPYSFTYAGQHWVPHQWLGEVIMALAYKVSGFDTFVLLAATILASLFTWLTLRLLRTGLNFAVVAVISGCALAATSTHLHVRPLLMTTVSMSITAALLTDFDAGKISRKRLLWLVPLFAAWTNIHGGMLGGLASLALVVGGWAIWKILGWPSPIASWRPMFPLILLGFLCGLTMFANPYGLEIPRVWLTIMKATKSAELIEEHQPLDLEKPAAWALLPFAAIYFFVLAGVRGKPHAPWLLPIFWLVQAFLHVRHAPLFAVTAFVAIAAMWPATRWAAWLAARRPDVYDPNKPQAPRSLLNWLIPAALVSASLILQATRTTVPVIGAGWARLDTKLWPVEILDAIHEQEPKNGRPARIFNDDEFGGFLIFYAPGYRIFVDDRAELYGDDFLEDFVRSSNENTEEALKRWQSQYGDFDYALVHPDSSFDDWFRAQHWQRLAACKSAVFYKR